MEPIRFDGASVDIGVLKRLRRLDKQLRVTFSPYSLDTETGLPIVMPGMLDPYTGDWNEGVVRDPAFYLWLKDNGSSHHFFVNVFPKFTHEEVMHLEADIARFNKVEHVHRLIQAAADARRARKLAEKKGLQKDKISANKKRIHDLVFDGKGSTRDAKVSSYRGQTRRTSANERERIQKDAREDGWELPEAPADAQ